MTDTTGNPEQQAYLRAGSQAYGYALSYPVDAGMLEPGATNYRSDAVHAMVEGLTQLWHGAPDDARSARPEERPGFHFYDRYGPGFAPSQRPVAPG